MKKAEASASSLTGGCCRVWPAAKLNYAWHARHHCCNLDPHCLHSAAAVEQSAAILGRLENVHNARDLASASSKIAPGMYPVPCILM